MVCQTEAKPNKTKKTPNNNKKPSDDEPENSFCKGIEVGKPMEQCPTLDIEEDHWMDAKEALEYGIVDKITEKLVF